jgi:dipeptidyl-peptidase-4
VDIHDNLFFLEGADQFVWTSERNGYNHIYLYRNDGKLLAQLTDGAWVVRNLFGVDEERRMVYYRSNQEDIKECHIYGVGLDGEGITRLSDKVGWHNAKFSPDYGCFINDWSDYSIPGKKLLCSSDGQTIRTLIDNKIPILDEYELSYPEYISIVTSDGTKLNASIIKPANFNPGTKYPVLVKCYGGPGSQMVRNGWGGEGFLWHNIFVQEGYIIFCVDNRGTGGRGKEFVNLAYCDVAKWAVHDHIEAAKYLAGLPYVDKDRIGIWGWSFGGYLTLLTMTKGADYFATGVAGAPVVCWQLYDNIYTERYMGLPDENAQGYDSASVFSYVDRLKGDLLIIHGAADDNVHVQNTMQLVEKLQSQKKQFSLMLYPGQDHSVSDEDGIDIHLHTLITEYILDNL